MENKTTFTPYLKKKFSSDKEGILNIRVTENRQSKYFSLKENLKEVYWNKRKCEVKINHPDYDRLNLLIEDKIKDLKKTFGVTENVKSLKLNDKGSFMVFFQGEIDHLQQRRKIGTYKSYKTSFFQLQSFLKLRGKTDILFSELDIRFVTGLETYLLGKGISNNSSKKYLSTIKKVYRQSVKMGVYVPTNDPFILFENKRVQVENKRLVKRDVDMIIQTEFQDGETLYDVRNYFLFQIFGQGLRVSDLITLRWDNIIEGRIEFVQLKTKKRHSVILSDVLLNILKDYIPGKCSDLFEEIYSFSFEGKEYKMNYPDLKNYYKKISKEGLQKFLREKDPKIIEFVETWKNQVDEIWFIVKSKLLIRITQYSRKNKSLFIFPILRNEDFKDLVFDNQTNLSQYQYNQLSSRTTVYNKQLKKLQEKCELNVVLTSHISRHTYTNILIDFTGNDIYSISKSLGHQRLSTTEHYIHQFTTERTDKVNNELNELFNFQ